MKKWIERSKAVVTRHLAVALIAVVAVGSVATFNFTKSATAAVAAPAAAARRERVVEASASADQETVPEFRALVFVVDTQYIISDSAVWRVQMWRVMLVSPVRDSLTGVPVAHSI